MRKHLSAKLKEIMKKNVLERIKADVALNGALAETKV